MISDQQPPAGDRIPARYSERNTAALKRFRILPKVDLHRHLEGSLRLDTMLDIARLHNLSIPSDVLDLSNLVQMQDSDSFTFRTFLAKFDTLRLFYRSPEVIQRITHEAIEDAAKDNVKYLELRVTPVALSRAERFPLHDVTDWMLDASNEAAQEFGIVVKVVLSVNRHESPQLAEQVAWLAVEHRANGIVGLDLAGNEAEFPTEPFYSIFREARQSGLHLTIHAGEWGPAANVRDAIDNLGAERIGHGVRVLEDKSVVDLARERGTAFEVCVTSNQQTGAVDAHTSHPLTRMLDQGLNVTLNTDDPSISRITLSHEYHIVCDELGLSDAALKERVLAAAQAAFLPPSERDALVEQMQKGLQLRPAPHTPQTGSRTS
jgi:adenosine deaminase